MSILDETRTIERPRFFNGQRLFAPDLQGVEALNRELRWLHNKSLHQPGIGSGYAVYGKKGEREVTVRSGYANDDEGREIILTRTHVEPVPPVAGEPDGTPTWFDLTIAYPTDDLLEATETREGVCLPRGVVRLREEPVFCWVRLQRNERGNLEPKDPGAAAEIRSGRRLVVARAAVLECSLADDLSIAVRRNARPPQQPRVLCGEADPTPWAWQMLEGGDPLELDDESLAQMFASITNEMIPTTTFEPDEALQRLLHDVRSEELRHCLETIARPWLHGLAAGRANRNVMALSAYLFNAWISSLLREDAARVIRLLDRLGVDTTPTGGIVAQARALMALADRAPTELFALYRALATTFFFPIVLPIGLVAPIDTRSAGFRTPPGYFARLEGPRLWRINITGFRPPDDRAVVFERGAEAAERLAHEGLQVLLMVDGLLDVGEERAHGFEVRARLLVQVLAVGASAANADGDEILDIPIDLAALDEGGHNLAAHRAAATGRAYRQILQHVILPKLAAWRIVWMGVE